MTVTVRHTRRGRGILASLLVSGCLFGDSLHAATDNTVALTTREDVATAWQTIAPSIAPDAPTPSVELTTPPRHGVVEIEGRRWRYRPAQDWYGEDTATLAWCMGPESCPATTVKLLVTPVNDPPALTPLTLTTQQDLPSAPTPLVITDPDAVSTPTLSILRSERGTATLEDDRLRFTPAYGVTGTAAVELMVCDEAGACVEATVPVRVLNVNDPPRLSVKPLEINEDADATPLSVTVRDPDPADTYDLVVTIPPEHGTAHATPDRQQLTYTPAADFHGDDHFFIAACDAAQACADARVTVTVRPINDPPSRVLLTLVTKQGRGTEYVTPLVLDADADDAHQFSLLSLPEGVHCELDATRTALRCLPKPGVSGSATFLLQACDRAGGCVVNDAYLEIIPTVEVAPDAGTLRVALLQPEALAAQAVDVIRTEPLALYGLPATPRLSGIVQVDAELDASAPVAYRLGEVTLRPGERRLIAYVDVDAHDGRLQLPIAPLPDGPVPHGAGGQLRLLVSEPNAPDIRVPLSLWDPATAIRLRADQPRYAAHVETVTIHAESGDSLCAEGVWVARETVRRPAQGRANRYCALRWLELPQGLQQVADSDRAQLNGYVSVEGSVARIRYQPGVLVFDDPQGPGRFVPGVSTQEYTLPLTRPQPPALFLIPVTDNPTGQAFTAAGPWPAAERRAQVVARSDYPGLTLTLGDQSHTTPHHQVQARLAGGPAADVMTVTAEHPHAPSLITRAELDFRAAAQAPTPRLAALARTPLAGEPITLAGRVFGLPGPLAVNGEGWQVELCQLQADRPPQVLTHEPVRVAPTGDFTFPALRLPAGEVTLAARVLHADQPGHSQESRQSAPLTITVAESGPIAVTLHAARDQGAVPFHADLQVVLPHPEQAAALGEVRWELSDDDGATWTALPAAAVKAPGLAYATTLTRPITRQYRVTSVNRFSGATQVTAPVILRAFEVPAIELLGFADTYLGRPSPWQIATTHPDPLRYHWRLEHADATTPALELEGPAQVLRAEREGTLVVTVAARLANAPEVPEAWRTVRRALQVTLPPLRTPAIDGPARLRAGETATYIARTAQILDTTAASGWRLGGQWHLPDGTTVAKDRVDYTAAVGDRPLRYEYWLEDFVSATRASVTHAPEIWTYRWPAWHLYAHTLRPYAPARIYYELQPDPAEALGPEPVTYTWDVPPGGVIEDRSGAGIVVRYDQPGSYALTAHVTDTQGHAAEQTHVLDALDPPPLGLTLTLTTADAWQRAPETVTATWEITGLTDTEVVAAVSLTVNDQEHTLTSREGARFQLETPGEHRVRLGIRTNYGRTAEDLRGLVLSPGVPPRCEIDSVMLPGQSRTLHARCAAAQGVIEQYRWVIRYADNGEEQVVTSRGSAIRLSRKAMQRGVAAVRLEAINDKNQASPAVEWLSP